MDNAIVKHLEKRHQISIGKHVARQAKELIGSAFLLDEPMEVKVKGSDLKTKLPLIMTINSNDIAEAMQGEIEKMLDTIAGVFLETRPELTSDILEKGVVFTGGVANLRGMDVAIRKAINVPVTTVDQPEHAVIRGIGKSIQTGHLQFHRRALLTR